MDLKTKKLDASKIEIEIEASAQELSDFIDKATLEMGKDVSVEGFRKGKAPKEIIESHVGHDYILEHAAQNAIEYFYKKAVEELKIEPIDRPEAEIKKLAIGNPFVFKVMVPIIPEVSLPDYKLIASKVERKKVSVEEKEIQETLNWLQKSRAKFSLKNSPAENGDLVEIEYSCPQIPEIVKEKAKKDTFILGEGKFISGFEGHIIGMEANKEKSFSLKIEGKNFPDNLEGKKMDFTVMAKSVQKVELPKIDDDFAKSIGKFENITQLKNNIAEGIKAEKEGAEKQKMRETILDEIGKSIDFEIPEILIQRERDAMIENMKHEVSHKFNMSFNEYLKQINKSEEEIISSFRDEARSRVKKFLILREIGKKEEIMVLDSEVEKEVNKFLEHYPNNPEIKEKKNIDRLIEYNKSILINEKIFNLLEGLEKNKDEDK